MGIGAAAFSGGGSVILDDFFPSSDLTSVTAKAYEAAGDYAPNWDVTAYAMCADPFPFAGLERRTATSGGGNNSTSSKTAKVGCSSASKRSSG